AAADESFAALLGQELEARDAHERAEDAHASYDPLRRLEELREVGRAVLDRDDVVDRRHPLGELRTDVDARAVRPVVDHQRPGHSVRDVLEEAYGLVRVRL